jgi:membrane protein YqaA with SNARE-associated domain
MDSFEMYSLLFTDSLVSNFAFNISTELALHSMKIFGLYNSYLVIMLASLAFMLAACINYGLGILCYNILAPLKSKGTNTNNINTDKIRRNKYLPFFLLLSAVPFFGKFIMLFAGFCKVRPILAISIGSLSRLIYYSIFMLV